MKTRFPIMRGHPNVAIFVLPILVALSCLSPAVGQTTEDDVSSRGILAEENRKYYSNQLQASRKKKEELKRFERRVNHELNRVFVSSDPMFEISDEDWTNASALTKDLLENLPNKTPIQFEDQTMQITELINEIWRVSDHQFDAVQRIHRKFRSLEYDENQLLQQIRDDISKTLSSARNRLAGHDAAWKALLDADLDLRNPFRRITQSRRFHQLPPTEAAGSVVNTENVKELLMDIVILTDKPLPVVKKYLAEWLPTVRQDIGKVVADKFQSSYGEFDAQIEHYETKLKEAATVLQEQQKQKQEEKQKEERRERAINEGLVNAIYLMIGALLLLFAVLRFFTPDIARELIVRRSLVEVIGIAFMLITIIILGTGEKLTAEILGTLLGTIAGYLFARTVQRNGGAPAPANATPGGTAPAAPAPGGQTP